MSGLDSDQPGREMSPFVVEHDRGASPPTKGHGLHAGGWSDAAQAVGQHTRKETWVSRNAGADQAAYPPSTERTADSYWHRPALTSPETVTNVGAPVQGLPVAPRLETPVTNAKQAARSGRARRWKTRSVPQFLVAALVLALGLSAGTAYAYMSASGSGTGTASTGTVTVTVEHATATPSTFLFPGTKAPLYLTVHNPQSFALKLTGVSQEASTNLTVTPSGTCTSANAGVTIPSVLASGLTIPIAAGPGTESVVVPTGATMSTSSNTACQGASFHIPVTVQVKS
jgi:hypothetical protein